MNLKALLNDRRFQVGGVVVAGAAGLLVWRRGRGKNAGATGSDQTSGAPGGGYVAGAFPDTSATDSANWMGQAQGAIADEMSQFMQTADDLQTALAGLTPVNTGSGSGAIGVPVGANVPTGTPISGKLPPRTKPMPPPRPGSFWAPSYNTGIHPIRRPS